MRSIIYILICAICFYSCEDVVDVDLPEPQSNLVVQAVLKINEVNFNELRISVTNVAPYFGEITTGTIETVQIFNEVGGGASFLVADPEVPGDYIPGSDGVPNPQQLLLTPGFNPEDRIILTFRSEEELYLAVTQFVPVVELIEIRQVLDTDVEDGVELEITIKDIPEMENFTIFDFGNGRFTTIDDEFIDGQEFTFTVTIDEEDITNNEITLSMYSADEEFYRYMNQLIEQAERSEDPIFQIPASTARGNILKLEEIDNIDLFNNVGRPDEFVQGYFAIVGEVKQTIVLQ